MTSDRDIYSGLQSLYLPIAAGVVTVFMLVVLFAVVRYRRRSDELPGQRHESKAEYVYIGALVLVAAFLLGATYHVENKTDRNTPPPGPRLRVNVAAGRWLWVFSYPDYGVKTTDPSPTLVVPTGTRITFAGTSRDVIHSFWVPAVRFKHDVFPSTTTHWYLTFDRPGRMAGECAEYCGLRHADMR